MAQLLTDRTVKALKAPAGKYHITYDSKVTGLGIRVTKTGVKSFVLNYHVNGRERRLTIGKYPTWSVAAARMEAAELRQLVDKGQDPMAERHARRAEPTVSDLCDRYLSDYARPHNRPSTIAGNELFIDKYIRPALGKLKVSSVEFSDIEAMHLAISRTAPYTANRVAALLSKMFNLSIKWKLRTSNPAKGIERNQEAKRKRYLTGQELRRLSKALADYPVMDKVRVSRAEALESGQKWQWREREKPMREREQSCNAIRLLMLTGARKNEVMSATWEQFDFDAGTWTKPGATTKQKTEHRIPLSAPALALLAGMPRTSEYVFPARRSKGKRDEADTYQKELKNAWASICELAEIPDVRVHDLRHTYAAQLASAGLSLPIIGALLGHSQPQTTARYSHLFDEPLRHATERVGAIVTGAGSDESSEVISIRGR